MVEAKNNSERQPVLNLHIAKAYLAGSDNGITTRTWQNAIESLIKTKEEENQKRWKTAAKERALVPLLPHVIVETQSELLLKALQMGTVSTNVYLRRLHNFRLDMNWLPWPLIPKRQWPAVRYKDQRAITWEEHCKIVEHEKNPERKAIYKLVWHLGASQSDLSHLRAEDVNWQERIICFVRMKTRWRRQQPPQIRFEQEVEDILATLPKAGALFPYLQTVRAGDRATEFKQRCVGLGIQGVTLHSYRFAWAERAQIAGYPGRFAQLVLGHTSKAVHRAYAKNAKSHFAPIGRIRTKDRGVKHGIQLWK